jgi:hypothetical protein
VKVYVFDASEGEDMGRQAADAGEAGASRRGLEPYSGTTAPSRRLWPPTTHTHTHTRHSVVVFSACVRRSKQEMRMRLVVVVARTLKTTV